MTDATKKLIEELRSTKNDFPSYLHSLCRVAADEIERLAKDSARLDWLDSQRGLHLYIHTTGDAKTRTGRDIIERFTPPCYSSARTAIDAASGKPAAKPDPFAPVSPESARKADWP